MKDLTDWDALRAMTDEDIERAAAADPDAPLMTNEDWANARVVWPKGARTISVLIDRDIVQWFGDRGVNYRAEMNEALRDYIKSQMKSRKGPSRSVVQRPKPRRKHQKRAAVKS